MTSQSPQGIALRVAAALNRPHQINIDRRVRAGVAYHVDSRAAVEDVRPLAPVERIVARFADKFVGAAIALEGVTEGRADYVLDRDEQVALGIAAVSESRG